MQAEMQDAALEAAILQERARTADLFYKLGSTPYVNFSRLSW